MPVTLTVTTYATVEELKERLAIPPGDDGSDTWLAQLLDAAALAVDACSRSPIEGYEAFSEFASEIRYFDDAVYGEPARLVYIDDLLTCTLVTRDGVTVPANEYKLWPYNRGNGPYTRLLWSSSSVSGGGSTFYGSPFGGVGAGTIAITGTWGYCDRAHRPPCVKEATLRQAELWYESAQISPTQLSQMLVNPFTSLRADIAAILRSVKREIRLA